MTHNPYGTSGPTPSSSPYQGAGWGYGQTHQPGYGKPFQRPFSHPETQLPAFPDGVQPEDKRTKRKKQRRTGFTFAIGYLVVIWAVFLLNEGLFGGLLQYWGIHPLDLVSIWHIFTAPLLHANLEHIVGNSVTGAIFAFLIGYSGKRVFWEVTTFATVFSGLGTWLFGGIGTNHLGASGVIYGWLIYLLVRGIFNRSGTQIALGLVLAFFYSGLILGVLPGTPGVSWQAHLFGAIGGFFAGMIITSDDPPELVAKREAKKARKQAGY
ncbi:MULTISPECIES: rhomboid family intramembrane serine protease [Corynebacterium]|uniref:Rhomboid family intramembrane serine protease n=1 Tax=Corynebacterium gottingense TaxID=2041036 RepID=A0ABX9UHR1_9CORY|nr:rhomboid family intramembrane serine protease [Corynebacterium gottingense]WJZ13802.1 Rhomboid family protein [Corynebacterium gottingense]WJZ16118.1 Rhomboid family protein [Corynebacterium gottingense]